MNTKQKPTAENLQFKGTKGEWIKDDTRIYVKSNLTDNGLMQIINTVNSPIEQREANAKLIASAPDLLEACIKRIEWSKKYPSNRIYSGSAMQKMIKESDEIDLQIEKAIQKALK